MGKKARTAAPRQDRETVVIAYIHPGEVSAFFAHALLITAMSDVGQGRRIVGVEQEWSSANVSAPRNNLTNRFLDHYDADWLWWIDADMAWEADALESLIASADKDTAPIVGGLCFGASHDELFPTVYQLAQIDGRLTTARMHDYAPDSLQPVAATGAAFLLIHRSVLEAMRERKFNATFPFFQETEMDGQPVGEDITFCLRALELGFPTHVNTAVKVGHHKSHLLTAELHARQRAVSKIPTGPLPTFPDN